MLAPMRPSPIIAISMAFEILFARTQQGSVYHRVKNRPILSPPMARCAGTLFAGFYWWGFRRQTRRIDSVGRRRAALLLCVLSSFSRSLLLLLRMTIIRLSHYNLLRIIFRF